MSSNLSLHPHFPTPSEAESRLTAEVADLKTIHGLSLRLAEASTLNDGLMDVLRTAARLVSAPLGTVQLLNSAGQLEMVGQIGFGGSVVDDFAIVTLKDCSTCAVALNRRARVSVPDLRRDHDFSQIASALHSYGAIGACSTPIIDHAGNVLAMFSVYWREQHDQDERALTALDLCAELAGRHVERSIAAKALYEHEQRQALLMRELAHRGKNLLTVVQAIARRSLSGDRTLDQARETFIGRLEALSNTYGTLTEQSPDHVPLTNIVSTALKSHSERIQVTGPIVLVPAKKAQTIALVIHELTTNAAKYGALSVRGGKVNVSWETTAVDFRLAWSEIGGPPATQPTKLGFGSAIITSVVGNELNCKPTTEYQPTGFHYELTCPLSSLTNS